MIRLSFKPSAVFLCALALIAGFGASAQAVNTSRAELQSRQFLIGTWNCSYTVGPRGGTYTTNWSNALSNRWLKQTYNQPPSGNEPGFLAEYLIGYDEARQAWVRFGAMTTGQYFAIRMTDTKNDGWAWKYVSFFSRRLRATSRPDTTFTKRSNVEYAVDGPTYPAGGKMVTEHHICRKS